MTTTKIEAIKSITREDGVTISLDSIVEVDVYTDAWETNTETGKFEYTGKEYEKTIKKGVVTRLITGLDVTETTVVTNLNKGYAWIVEMETLDTVRVDIKYIKSIRSATPTEYIAMNKAVIPSTILPHGGGTYWKVPLVLRNNKQNTPLYVVEGGTYGVLHTDALEHTDMRLQFIGQVTKVSNEGVYMQGRFQDNPESLSIIHCDVRLIRPVLLHAQFSYERDSLYSSVNKTQEGEV